MPHQGGRVFVKSRSAHTVVRRSHTKVWGYVSSLQYFFWRHHSYLSPLCSPCSGHYKAIGSANLKLSDSRTQVCGQLVLILWIIDSVKARNTLVHSASAWQCLYTRLVILEGPEFNFTAVQKLFQTLSLSHFKFSIHKRPSLGTKVCKLCS